MQVRQFVSGYSDAPPSTVGSVLVQDVSTGGQYSAVDSATVHFKPIPDDTIEQLIQEGTVFSCAGAATQCILSCLFYSVTKVRHAFIDTDAFVMLLFNKAFRESSRQALPRTILCTMTCLC